MSIDQQKRKEVYENLLIDRENMITAITEAAWCAETKNHNQDDLYNTIAGPNGSVIREVKEEWASVFFSLRSAYSALVESYIQYKSYATDQESTTGNDQGRVLSEGER